MSVDDELEKIKLDMMRRMVSAKPSNSTILKPGEVNELTDASFHAALAETDKPVLVDFWADWCAPCRMMAPVVQQMASELSGRAFVVKLNVDQNQRTATQFGVMSIPNFIVFKGGKPAGQVLGAVGKPSLQQLLQRHMP
ncbi:MAG TPA: thioredoxin [Candidatus Desulfaltia sp.]|nr:thioredoxin [Candidatus Desulfaltia sp.]